MAIINRLVYSQSPPSKSKESIKLQYLFYRREIFYLKSAKILLRGLIISKDVRRCSEEFRLTQTQEHKGTLTSLLKKENLEKVNHPHRLFFSLFGSGLFK